MKTSHQSILRYLADAAQAQQAAFELAKAAGDEPLAAIIRRGGVLIASAITATVSPITRPAREATT